MTALPTDLVEFTTKVRKALDWYESKGGIDWREEVGAEGISYYRDLIITLLYESEKDFGRGPWLLRMAILGYRAANPDICNDTYSLLGPALEDPSEAELARWKNPPYSGPRACRGKHKAITQPDHGSGA